MSSPSAQNILIIGAGAVGQVYGLHLHRGGASVSFMVRPRHEASCRQGLRLYEASERGAGERFDRFGVVTRWTEVAVQRWDQVWLAMTSDALCDEAWLDRLVGACGDALIVTLQPGLAARARLEQRVASRRLVSGFIGFVAYQGPLGGEQRPEPGVTYWFPPMMRSLFTAASEDEGAQVVAPLRRGGCPARLHDDAQAHTEQVGATMLPVIVGLEAAAWSLPTLRRRWMGAAAAAAREALGVLEAERGAPLPMPWRLISAWPLRLGSSLASLVAPIPLEAYLRFHFEKTRPQTQLLIRGLLERGAVRRRPMPALEALAATAWGPDWRAALDAHAPRPSPRPSSAARDQAQAPDL